MLDPTPQHPDASPRAETHGGPARRPSTESSPLLADGSRQAVAYTPLPTSGAGSASHTRRWLLVGATAAVTLLGGVGISMLGRGSTSGPNARAALTAATYEQVLFVGQRDFDRDATDAARLALAGGLIPELGAQPTLDERSRLERAVETALPQVPAPVRARAAQALARATPAVRRELQAGRMGVFRLHVLDTVAEDGDVVWLSLDGVPFGALELANAGVDVAITLPLGTPAHLLVVAERDGGGGVTFGAASSQGEMRTRVMRVGDREEWTVVVR